MERSNIEKLIQGYRFNIIKMLLDRNDTFWQSISGIKMIAMKNGLKIVYSHITDNYTLNDYCLHDESESDEIDLPSS